VVVVVADQNLIFVDTETTGLDVRRHHVWEIAVILREPDAKDVETVWQVRPDLTEAEPKALEIGRYHERFVVPDGWDAACIVDGKPTFRLTLPEFLYDLQDTLSGGVLIGSNPAFDDRFLTALLQDHGRRIPWHYRPDDVVAMAAGWLYAHGETAALGRPWRSWEISEAVGVPRPSGDVAHTALGDCRWARDLYDAVTGGA
jgi:DNA polymerase III epsilon subunit-like protein